jgi:chromosome segregation ATPase
MPKLSRLFANLRWLAVHEMKGAEGASARLAQRVDGLEGEIIARWRFIQTYKPSEIAAMKANLARLQTAIYKLELDGSSPPACQRVQAAADKRVQALEQLIAQFERQLLALSREHASLASRAKAQTAELKDACAALERTAVELRREMRGVAGQAAHLSQRAVTRAIKDAEKSETVTGLALGKTESLSRLLAQTLDDAP